MDLLSMGMSDQIAVVDGLKERIIRKEREEKDRRQRELILKCDQEMKRASELLERLEKMDKEREEKEKELLGELGLLDSWYYFYL